MTAAIYNGLIYGMIAGFGVAGFVLTLAALYGLIEILSWCFGVHDKYFTEGNNYERRGKD